MHVFQLVAREKVVNETVIIFLVFIINTLNPAQVLQGNYVISLVSVIKTVQISQINTLVHV